MTLQTIEILRSVRRKLKKEANLYGEDVRRYPDGTAWDLHMPEHRASQNALLFAIKIVDKTINQLKRATQCIQPKLPSK